MPRDTDVLIAGGGLAGGLIALALAARRPDLAVTIVEAGDRIGGNHLWSFFDADIDPADAWLVAPLVGHRWPAYDIAFPAFRRTIVQPYNSIRSEWLDEAVRAALPAGRIVAGSIETLDAGGATLADGRRIAAGGVIDARGATAMAGLDLGWQKFSGKLLRLAAPHGLTRPIVMDATVDQADGYRFVYVLPFDETGVFVEDTYYSTEPDFDLALLDARIAAYAEARGWTVVAVERREAAALPIAMDGAVESLWRDGAAGVGLVGMAAGLFQPMTGYSLPDAVRTAAAVAALPDPAGPALHAALRARAIGNWRERGYYRLLAKLLFRAAPPAERYRMLQRFYSLKPSLIGRFYAGRSTALDKVRILCGKPPVPIGAALKVIFGG